MQDEIWLITYPIAILAVHLGGREETFRIR